MPALAGSSPSWVHVQSPHVSPFPPLYLLCSPQPTALGTCHGLVSQSTALSLSPATPLYFSLSAVSASLIKDIASPYKPCLQRLNRTEVAITTTELFASKKQRKKVLGRPSESSAETVHHVIPVRTAPGKRQRNTKKEHLLGKEVFKS